MTPTPSDANPTVTGTACRPRNTAVAAAVAATFGVLLAQQALSADTATSSELQNLKDQVQHLQKQIDRMQEQQAPAAATSAPAASGAPSFHAGPVTVTLGGFVELMVIERNRNESADWASNFNTSIPYPNSHNYYLNEFHLSERQSRLQALAQGPEDANYATEAYVESDFGGATANGNYNESNSFGPRVRHFYADLQSKTGGWYLLFGQTWSLITGFKQANMMPRQENIVQTIDGQYVPGFSWLRVPQVRLVKSFNSQVSFGLSLENPAALVTSSTTTGAPAVATFYNNPGATNAFGPSNSVASTNLTTDPLPDVVAKFAFDPGWGHYEVFGMSRWFRARYTVAGQQNNQTRTAGGFGANMILPLVPKMLDFQASFLGGKGVGRYGSAQLPDATLNPANGAVTPIRGYQALAGFVLKPAPAWTLYVYGGKEQVDSQSFFVTTGGKTNGYGYGNPLFDNSGCESEVGTACAANTSSITSGTVGGWWKFYQGTLGNMQIGLSDTYIRRSIFSGVGGDPRTNMNIALASFRFYPYQK